MHKDVLIRRALRASAIFNCGGALLFAFPASLGRLAGLPTPVPAIYPVLLVMFILLFGGSYAWIARQPEIDRPLVALAAIGKAGAFAAVLGCWLFGQATLLAVIAFTGDLIFVGIFAWWLFDPATDPAASARSVRDL